MSSRFSGWLSCLLLGARWKSIPGRSVFRSCHRQQAGWCRATDSADTAVAACAGIPPVVASVPARRSSAVLLQAVEVSANNGIALASGGFQTFADYDGDAPACVADESCVLQRGSGDADGLPLHAEHHRQKLMAQLEILFVHPVMGHQQPPSASLLHVMERIARGGLHHLREEDLGVASHEIAECAAFPGLTPKIFDVHLDGTCVRHLNECFTRCDGIGCEKRIRAEHPFVTNRRSLNRCHSTVQEIHVARQFTVFMKHLSQADGDGFQIRTQAVEVVAGQGGV
jgi:hypothetical protein